MSNTINTVVLYHANCFDGFTAAWIAKHHGNLPETTEFIPVSYGEDAPWDEIEGNDIFILDFSYKAPVMEEIADRCHTVCVLDHHKTAKEEFEKLSKGIPNLDYMFDMEKCGAILTWEYFNDEDVFPPIFVRYVQDRDLWQWKLDASEEINAAIGMFSFTFDEWNRLADTPLHELELRGRDLLKKQREHVARIIEGGKIVDTLLMPNGDYYTMAVCNCPYVYASTVANEMLRQEPMANLAMCWFLKKNGIVQFSLRSEDSRVDVSQIATVFGGGGHRNAAGFELHVQHTFVRQVMELGL